MVDAPNNFDPQPPTVPVVAEKPANFLASTTGKLVLGAAALVIVLAIIGAIAWVFLFNTASSQLAGPGGTTNTQTGATASGSTPASEAAPIVEPPRKPLESTFTFRNVFAPTLRPPTPASVIASALAASTSSNSTKVSVPRNTLFLQSIQTVDGKKTATLIWNDATFSLGVGGTIAGTPWKVLQIGDSSVVMLFGDSEVTLTTGQGLSK